VERHHAQLEGQAGNDEDQAEYQYRPVAAAECDALPDLGNFQAAGRAIHHRHAVEQQSGGHRAEDEVLHRRLGGAGRVAVDRHQRIQG
jgi:hypothetical protein